MLMIKYTLYEKVARTYHDIPTHSSRQLLNGDPPSPSFPKYATIDFLVSIEIKSHQGHREIFTQAYT